MFIDWYNLDFNIFSADGLFEGFNFVSSLSASVESVASVQNSFLV